MHLLIGFLIALAVGLTGIGGGSFTVPAMVLILGLPPGEAVGTAFVFAAALRMIATPFYVLDGRIHLRYLWLLLQGAVPGLLVGIYLLRLLSAAAFSPVIVIVLGLLLAGSSSLTFAPPLQNPRFAQKNPRWLPWLALPIGVEAGFSSAGAGVLGTMLLLNYSEISPADVVGTDLVFGLVLAGIGSVFHWQFGLINYPVLVEILAAGVPGVLLGCLLARWFPARKLRSAIAMVAIFAGLLLVWSGSRSLWINRANGGGKITGVAARLSPSPMPPAPVASIRAAGLRSSAD
jgi:uncharacterized protein